MSIGPTKDHRPLRLVIIVTIVLLPIATFALNIDSTYKYAWGENIGWINWGTTQGDVDVSASDIDGYAWGENVGWISLSCSNTSSCGAVNYGISRTGDVLSGYAWGENVGWISFACENTSSCGTVDYGVEIDSSTGNFSGYAWGENVGWIVFNCSTTSSCGTVDYRVATTSTTPTPGAAIVPPGGTPVPSASPGISPSLSVSPTVTPSPVTTATPTTRPPIATPSVTPNPSPPVEPPLPRPIEIVGRGIDAIANFVFAGAAGWLRSTCGQTLPEAGACAATGTSLIALILSLLAMLLQHQVAATVFSLLQIVGLKKRSRVWGTVYDARTKRPVPFVKMELLDAHGRVLETRYADRDGRYGFLLSPSMLHGGEQVQISIHATKSGYRFPSGISVSGVDYFVYDHLYQGGPITVRSDSVLIFNIPIDPVLEKRTQFGGLGRSLTGPLIERVLNLGFYAGLILVPLNLYLMPNAKNWIILGVFLAANLFRRLAMYRPYGITVDATTGKRLPFALITLNEITATPGVLGRRVAFAVSDEFGRYVLSAPRDHDYELVAHTPANLPPPRETHQRITLSSGWMTETVRVGTNEPTPVATQAPAGVMRAILFFLFAVGFAAGRPRIPGGAMGEGIDEAYGALHPYTATLSQALHTNAQIISLLALIATVTVVAGAILAAREAFSNWLRGRRGAPPEWVQTSALTAFVLGAIAIPLTYVYQPTTGRAVLAIMFFAASGVWAHAIRRIRH